MAALGLVLRSLLTAQLLAAAPAATCAGSTCSAKEGEAGAGTGKEAQDEASLLQFKRPEAAQVVRASAPSTVKASVVPINTQSPSFPKGKPKIAMCASGGGNRASSFTTGVLRGLTELGFMEHVEALSAVSGGAWASSVYMFANRSTTQLLGPGTEPSGLTLEFLRKNHSQILQGAVSPALPVLTQLDLLKTPPNQIWQKIIGQLWLEPFLLNNPAAYLADSEASVARIKRQNPALQDADFNVPMPQRPADFIILGALVAGQGFVASTANTVSLQMSPDYIGSPFYPDDSKVVFERSLDFFHLHSVTALVGGGMVESFAFGGDAPLGHGQSGGEAVEVPAPDVPFTLRDAVGISSWSYGLQLENTFISFVNPSVNYWPVTSEEFPPPEPTMDMHATDGGNYDNSGLLPLLQREAERVVWVASSYEGLNDNYPWKSFCSGSLPADGFDPVLAQVIDQVIGKFGYGDKVTDEGNYLLHNQVFKREGLLPLSCRIWELKSQRKPAVIKFNQTVIPNTWWGIQGGNTVEIILIYLESVIEFNKALPEETQAELGKGEMFRDFPLYPTTELNPPEPLAYTEPQVNLLAALGEYDVLQNKELFQSFMPSA